MSGPPRIFFALERRLPKQPGAAPARPLGLVTGEHENHFWGGLRIGDSQGKRQGSPWRENDACACTVGKRKLVSCLYGKVFYMTNPSLAAGILGRRRGACGNNMGAVNDVRSRMRKWARPPGTRARPPGSPGAAILHIFGSEQGWVEALWRLQGGMAQ